MGRRAFVVVIDACGIGALPDAATYGDDPGANTLAHVAELEGGLRLPVLAALGLGSILPLRGVAPAARPALHGRLSAQGPGKDSTAGHWELMGVVAAAAPTTYPAGLPPELLADVEREIGRPVICNRPYDGVAAIEDYGAAHLASGRPILYTSVDSVLQIACHRDAMSLDELYAACERVRAVVGVGRVIARPFSGEPGYFERTPERRDFALAPPSRSYLQALQGEGLPVHAVGKVGELFAGAGIDQTHPGATNAQAIASIGTLLVELTEGIVFANLIETDQSYGHRKDTAGFHQALAAIDAALGGWLERLRRQDMLVITADHGCDPRAAHSDHTRASVPLLASFAGDGGRRHDGVPADVGASLHHWLTDEHARGLPGRSFVA
jgi:phosphopentomutase